MFKKDLLTLLNTNTRTIIGTDLNARNTLWGNVKNNTNLAILSELSLLGSFTFEYPDSYTVIPHRGNPSKPITIDDLNSDHFPILTEIDSSDPPTKRFNYYQADWARFGQVIDLHIASTEVQTTSDIDEAIETLERAIKTAEKECIPEVIIRNKIIQLDTETKQLIGKRNMLRRQHQRTGNIIFKQQASFLSRLISFKVDEIRNRNFANHLEKLKPYSNAFWKIAKVYAKQPRPIPPLTVNGQTLIEATGKTDTLAKQFVSAHEIGNNINSHREVSVVSTVRSLDEPTITIPSDTRITVNEVKATLRTLSNMKAPGFDSIFNLLLKKLNTRALELLANLFSRCMELGYFPECWKCAKAIPILKPGKDPTKPASYRPISLLAALGKLFEKLIHWRLREIIDELRILPPEQFGFRPGHSTIHQLVRLRNTVEHNKQHARSTAVIMLDFEKAFDNVWHDGLLSKMINKGIPTFIIKVIRSYLCQRSFRVSLGKQFSGNTIIPAGVPQGSILAPTLFMIYLSDIPPLPHYCELFLFADDTAIAVKGRTVNELKTRPRNVLIL